MVVYLLEIGSGARHLPGGLWLTTIASDVRDSTGLGRFDKPIPLPQALEKPLAQRQDLPPCRCQSQSTAASLMGHDPAETAGEPSMTEIVPLAGSDGSG
jgi:hypothetical protein